MYCDYNHTTGEIPVKMKVYSVCICRQHKTQIVLRHPLQNMFVMQFLILPVGLTLTPQIFLLNDLFNHLSKIILSCTSRLYVIFYYNMLDAYHAYVF